MLSAFPSSCGDSRPCLGSARMGLPWWTGSFPASVLLVRRKELLGFVLSPRLPESVVVGPSSTVSSSEIFWLCLVGGQGWVSPWAEAALHLWASVCDQATVVEGVSLVLLGGAGLPPESGAAVPYTGPGPSAGFSVSLVCRSSRS